MLFWGRGGEKRGIWKVKKNPVKIIKFQRKPQTSVKQLSAFLGCKVQSPKHLSPGWQITLQVLQVQTGDPGSGTAAHNLNRFIGCFCPHHCQKGRQEEVEQQQHTGQLCGRWRDPSWDGGSSHQGWCSSAYSWCNFC